MSSFAVNAWALIRKELGNLGRSTAIVMLQIVVLGLLVAVILYGISCAFLFGLSLGLLILAPDASLELLHQSLRYLGVAAGCAVLGAICAPFAAILDRR